MKRRGINFIYALLQVNEMDNEEAAPTLLSLIVKDHV